MQTVTTSGLINLKNLEVIANGDEQFIQEMVQLFISSTENGIVQIKKAFAANNFGLVADQAHKISSPCRHIGAIRLYELLKAVEKNARSEEPAQLVLSSILDAEDEAARVLADARQIIR